MLSQALQVMALAALMAPAARPPSPPSPEEEKAFAEGVRLLGAGDARGAERSFKAGYDVGHDPAFLVRIGEAQEKAGATREALESYERYLRESPEAADREDIEGRIRRLAPTRQAAAPPAGQAEAPPAGETAAEPVGQPAPGQAGSAGEAAGGKVAQAIDPGGAPAGMSEKAAFERLGYRSGPRTMTAVAAWGGVAVTVALLGVATFFGARASEQEGNANRLLTYTAEGTTVPLEYSVVAAEYEKAIRDGERYNGIAKGLAIAAGVTAVASIVLFIVDGVRGEGSANVATARRPRRSDGAGLAWSF
jgi:hypothetical protein